MATSNPSVTPPRARPPGVPLRHRVVRGLQWEVSGQVGMHLWRLAVNLITTRLLAPEAFGVIGLAQVFVLFLTLVSNVGLQGSVIHHVRGDDRDFLNTVWTVGVIRGFLIWLILWLGAVPFANFYATPDLAWVLPLIGFSAAVRGFSSTSVLTASRHLNNSWFVKVDCGSQLIGTTATLLIAFFIRSVLALALGWIVTALAYLLLSYCRSDIRLNRFCWDRHALKSLWAFGRWAMASGGFMLVQLRGDRLAFGCFVSSAELGVYVIGANLAILPMTLFWRINTGIAQPFYAQICREMPDRRRRKIRRMRLGILLSHIFPLALLVVFGQPVVDLVYNAEYSRAGWFCSLVALASMVLVSTDMGPIFPARGDARTHFNIMAVRTLCFVLGIIGGFYVGRHMGDAFNGMLYGIVVSPLLSYPYQAVLYHRIHAWLPEVDALGLSCVALLIAGQAGGFF